MRTWDLNGARVVAACRNGRVGKHMRFGLVAPAFALALTAFAAEAAGPDPALGAFLAKFADMAARGATDSMARVTRFPLRNRVHQQPDRVSAAGFKHHFMINGFRELAACLKSTSPQRVAGRNVEAGEWEVDCDGNVFYFAQEGGGWRFSGFENVNE